MTLCYVSEVYNVENYPSRLLPSAIVVSLLSWVTVYIYFTHSGVHNHNQRKLWNILLFIDIHIYMVWLVPNVVLQAFAKDKYMLCDTHWWSLYSSQITHRKAGYLNAHSKIQTISMELLG